jgi:hypothetical protein
MLNDSSDIDSLMHGSPDRSMMKKRSIAYVMTENQINFLPFTFFQDIMDLENQFSIYCDLNMVHKLINLYKVKGL